MMTILTSNKDIDRAAWSALVHSSPTGTWFQTPEAYDFFAGLQEEFRPFVVALVRTNEARNEQLLLAVCVGYITVEQNSLKQFFTRRAIIIGGPALADDCTCEEVTLLMANVKRKVEDLGGAIYIETRNLNNYSQWRKGFEKAGFNYESHLNYHLDCSDEEMLFKNMNESRRRQVKKGLKNGAIIEEAQDECDVHDYYLIMRDLYRTKVKTPLFDERVFMEFYRKQYGKYLLVKYEGKVIGGIMSPILQEKAIYEWFVCGLDGEYRDQYPSVLATYAAMVYGAQHGLCRFDFMGAGKAGDGYGVCIFKERFGGKQVEHGRYLCILNPLLYACGTLGVKVLKKLK
ncbi:MAG: lipid II:glycine glycyltransferase FemX [Paludibacteraceae bacterium]